MCPTLWINFSCQWKTSHFSSVSRKCSSIVKTYKVVWAQLLTNLVAIQSLVNSWVKILTQKLNVNTWIEFLELVLTNKAAMRICFDYVDSTRLLSKLQRNSKLNTFCFCFSSRVASLWNLKLETLFIVCINLTIVSIETFQSLMIILRKKCWPW